MILIENLSKKFISQAKHSNEMVAALNAVSFRAGDGEITALLGPNGAGKTTLLRILSGLEHADSGVASVNGLKLKSSLDELAYLSEGCGLYSRLTAYENIAYFGELYGLDTKQIDVRIQFLSPYLALDGLLQRTVGGFSQGERMRIAIARAVIHDPQTIILDEPTNGLDLHTVRKLREFLKFLASPEGGSKCVLFSTHNMHEVEKLADRVLIIQDGKIKSNGTLDELRALTGEQDFEEVFYKLTS